MCVLVFLFGPRAILFFSCIFQFYKFEPVYAHIPFIWNLLGFIFVPWTTLSLVLFSQPLDTGAKVLIFMFGCVEVVLTLIVSLLRSK